MTHLEIMQAKCDMSKKMELGGTQQATYVQSDLSKIVLMSYENAYMPIFLI